VPRLLLPLLAVLALVVQSASTWAAAGAVTDVHCCCPSKEVCKCHEHQPGPDTSMKRCGGGEHEVLPELAVSTVVEAPPVSLVEVSSIEIEHFVPELSTIPARAPDKPPF
jgi:hypothetical protein